MQLPLPIHSYQHLSRPVGVERLVNCYAEKTPPEGKAPAALMRAEGIVSAVTTTNLAGRGLFQFRSRLYALIGTNLWRVNSDHSLTSIGTVNGASVVSFASNPTQLVICDPSASYVYDESVASFQQITDADFTSRAGAQCCDVDGFILFREPNSGRFFGSALNNALAYDALDFATAEGLSDNLVGIISDHRQAVLGGEFSMELWENSGGSGFPFSRDPNGFLQIGCAAGATMARVDNSIFWLASDLTVRRLDGITPIRISQHGVEQAIATYTVTDAYAFGFSRGGHLFYVLTFPTDGATWVYDATTTEWHERQSYGINRWRICSSAQAYGRTYVQDFENGWIGYFDASTYTEFDDIQRMEFTFPSVYADGERHFHNSLQIRAETGVGTATGQGANPQMTLEVSDDGGRTFTTMPTKSLGPIGARKTTVYWERLGYSDDRVYRGSISDPVKVVIADAQLSMD